jgi:hypothetical protein
MTYHQICNKSNTTGSSSGAWTAYIFCASEVFLGIRSVLNLWGFVCVVFLFVFERGEHRRSAPTPLVTSVVLLLNRGEHRRSAPTPLVTSVVLLLNQGEHRRSSPAPLVTSVVLLLNETSMIWVMLDWFDT